MKHLLVTFLIILFSTVKSHSQQINWEKTYNWRIYDISDRLAIKISIDSLKLLKSIPIQKDSILYYMSDVSDWPTSKKVVWMGVYTLTFETNTYQTRKLLVSSYGGFVYDSFAQKYYEIDITKRNDWQAFLINQLTRDTK